MADKATVEIDATTAKFFRTILGQCSQALNSADESGLAEPWLSHYRKLKSDYDSALKDLPESDKVPLALDASRQLSCLYSMLSGFSNMYSYMNQQINSLKSAASSSMNSAVDAAIQERIKNGELVAKSDVEIRVTAGVTAGIAAEITRRTTAGELVPKDTVTQLCSSAKETGISEGKTAAKADYDAEKSKTTVIETRKAGLQTAGIPIPEKDIDKLLAGTDAEFEVAKATAKTRMEALQGKGLSLNSAANLYSNIWLPADQYATFEKLVAETHADRTSAEPFAGATRSGAGGTEVPAMLV